MKASIYPGPVSNKPNSVEIGGEMIELCCFLCNKRYVSTYDGTAHRGRHLDINFGPTLNMTRFKASIIILVSDKPNGIQIRGEMTVFCAFLPQSAWFIFRPYDGTARRACHRHNARRRWLYTHLLWRAAVRAALSVHSAALLAAQQRTKPLHSPALWPPASLLSSSRLQWMGKGASVVYEHTSLSMTFRQLRMFYSNILWQIIHWTHYSFSI